MRLTLLLLLCLALGSVAEAKGLKSTPITRSMLQELLGTQTNAVLSALSKDQVVITVEHDASPFKRDFDLHTLHKLLFSYDEKGITNAVKEAVNRAKDSSGYIFASMADEAIHLHSGHPYEYLQYKYYYYTKDGLEWIKIVGLGKKINMSLSYYDVEFLSDDYSLEDALHDNHFYMERYTREDQASVRYLKELREALNDQLSEELGEELRRHNLGAILLTPSSLAEIDDHIEHSRPIEPRQPRARARPWSAEIADHIEPRQQRNWQKALMALKAELTAEALVAGLRKGELMRDDFTAEQVEMAERVVRLKNDSIAKRNEDIHGKLHFYAFRIPRAYLHRLLVKYAENNNLSDEQKQALLHRLFHEQKVNYKAVKFGQTKSTRSWQARVSELTVAEQEQLSQILVDTMPQEKYQEVVKQTDIPRKQPTTRKQPAKEKSTPPAKKLNDLVNEINLDKGNVEVRIYEQLRDIVDVKVLKEIGGDAHTLVKEAQILAYAPPSDNGLLDTNILDNLFGEDVKAAQMVAGKSSSETVVFLAEGEELALDAEVIELVRARFSESVTQFNDYLDRRERESIAFPRFGPTVPHSKSKAAARLSDEKKILAYFEDHKAALQGDGIVSAEMAKDLRLSSGNKLTYRITALQEKLKPDKDHFIHKIISKQKKIKGKYVTFYIFDDGALISDEKKILAYFEEHKAALQEDGIVNTEIAKNLGLNSYALGRRITALQEKLKPDKDHFIHNIIIKQKRIKDKYVTFYIFDDGALISDEEILAYFEEHKAALQGDGIVVAEMAADLGLSSGMVLGSRITALQKKLGKDHFIHKIISNMKTIEGKRRTVYTFDDALTSDERGILAYFEEHKSALQGDGIVQAKMVKELGISMGRNLTIRIATLQEKLDGGHFIHKIISNIKTIEGKRRTVYTFDDALTSDERGILAYFEEHKSALQGDGIVQAKMVKELGISSGDKLTNRITALQEKLGKDHFIHKITRKPKWIKGKYHTVYHFDDALTSDERGILAYFEEHKTALQEGGIVNTEIAKNLGLNSYALRRRITALQEKLDGGHFIHKIISKPKWIKGKQRTVYTFDDIPAQEKNEG